MEKKKTPKSIAGKVLRGINILLVLITFPVALVPILNPSTFWFVAVLGILFPYLLAANLLFIIYWSIRKSRWFLISLITLMINAQQVFALVGFSFFKTNNLDEKSPGTLRVLSWNVSRWDETNKDSRGGVSYRPLMMDAIKTLAPDVLCLQEFFEPRTSDKFDKNIIALEKMGYTYHYFYPVSIIVSGEYSFGMTIFSRMPIIDSGKVSFGSTPHSEGLIYADIQTGMKVVRVYSVHMESFRMGKDSYTGNFNGNFLQQSSAIGSSIKSAYTYRTTQADIVRTEISKSPHPAIVAGNLGDVPNSYAYFTVKRDMQDAFLKRKAGFGKTFLYYLPTLRVDYILCDKRLGIDKFDMPEMVYSDHYPLVADIVISETP